MVEAQTTRWVFIRGTVTRQRTRVSTMRLSSWSMLAITSRSPRHRATDRRALLCLPLAMAVFDPRRCHTKSSRDSSLLHNHPTHNQTQETMIPTNPPSSLPSMWSPPSGYPRSAYHLPAHLKFSQDPNPCFQEPTLNREPSTLEGGTIFLIVGGNLASMRLMQ